MVAALQSRRDLQFDRILGPTACPTDSSRNCLNGIHVDSIRQSHALLDCMNERQNRKIRCDRLPFYLHPYVSAAGWKAFGYASDEWCNGL